MAGLQVRPIGGFYAQWLKRRVSEWVSSFLTAHQHKIGHSMPHMVKIS